MQIRAKNFRKNMTGAEKRIWYFLRGRRFYGYKFIREMAIDPYIADFACREKKVIVEIDGDQHAEISAMQYDHKRTVYLEKCGYKVIRFWNEDVFRNIEKVLEEILKKLERE